MEAEHCSNAEPGDHLTLLYTAEPWGVRYSLWGEDRRGVFSAPGLLFTRRYAGVRYSPRVRSPSMTKASISSAGS